MTSASGDDFVVWILHIAALFFGAFMYDALIGLVAFILFLPCTRSVYTSRRAASLLIKVIYHATMPIIACHFLPESTRPFPGDPEMDAFVTELPFLGFAAIAAGVILAEVVWDPTTTPKDKTRIE